MAAPLVAAQTGAQVAGGVVKVLSTDIVTLEGRLYYRRRLKEPRRTPQGAVLLTKGGRVRYRTIVQLEPVSVALHANPIGIGVLGVLGAAAAVLLFGRLRVGVPTIGEVQLYNGPLADEFDAWKEARALRKGQERAESCEGLEVYAGQLDAAGVALSGGMSCRELRTLSGCGTAHSAAAKAAIQAHCI